MKSLEEYRVADIIANLIRVKANQSISADFLMMIVQFLDQIWRSLEDNV